MTTEVKLYSIPANDALVIRHLEQMVTSRENWYLALLQAISSWEGASEVYKGHTYRYLIAGEAFDFLVLAERLCSGINALIPKGEKEALLFNGKPPIELTADEFRNLIGVKKYQQYLNYFYGITVEEALIQAVREEVRKERWALGFHEEEDYDNEAFRRLYRDGQMALLKHFRREMGYQNLRSTSLTELKEFTYWLFKFRINHSDGARVASDTKKALSQLSLIGFPGRLTGRRRPKSVLPISE